MEKRVGTTAGLLALFAVIFHTANQPAGERSADTAASAHRPEAVDDESKTKASGDKRLGRHRKIGGNIAVSRATALFVFFDLNAFALTT
jgi:hypothetical protein